MFRNATAMCLAAVVLCAVNGTASAQGSAGGCSAIVARPNQQLGGVDLTGFTPWGGQSGWTRDISSDPVDPNSPTWVASVKGDGNPFLMPDKVVNSVVVTAGQTRISAPLTSYPTVSDPGPYPIPLPPLIQGTGGTNYSIQGDRHLAIIDKESCLLYELYGASYNPLTKDISAGSAAVYDLLSGDHQRPYLWTGGSVAGVPWSFHALRYDEVASGEIRHALTFAARNAWGRAAFTDLASAHQYTTGNVATLPPFGARARLRADFDVSSFSPNIRVVLNALKRYGMVYVDGGYPIDLHVEVDDRWDTQELNQLRSVFFAGNFEFVKTGPIYNDSMYGLATAPPKGPAPVIASFTASSISIAAGTAVTLAWSVSGAGSRVRIVTPDVGPIVGDSVVVTPPGTTTYTLSVENAYGVTRKTLTVYVTGDCQPGLPAISASVLTPSVAAGQSASVLVSIANTDSAGCAPEQFALTHTLPQGWTGTYSEPRLTIAPGNSATATLTVAAPNDGARGDTPITAAVSGMAGTATQTATVSFTPQQSVRLALSTTTVGGGKPVTGTVTLVNPAPAGGAVVALAVSGSAAKAPASVTIAEGAYSVSFPIATTAVSNTVYASVAASYAGIVRSSLLRVDPAVLWFIGVITPVDGGSVHRSNNVFMTGAVVQDTVVTMSSSDPSVASPQPTVTIPANATQMSYTIATKPVSVATTVQITATCGGVSRSNSITVRPTIGLSALTLSPATVAGGSLSSLNTVALSAPATASTTVTLSSDTPSVVVPAQVTIPAGASSTTFTIATANAPATLNATVTATYAGVALAKTLTVAAATIATDAAPVRSGLSFTVPGTAVSGSSGHIGDRTRVAIPTGDLAVDAQSGYFAAGEGGVANTDRIKVSALNLSWSAPGTYMIGYADMLQFPAGGVADQSTFAVSTMYVEETPPGSAGAPDGSLKVALSGTYTNRATGLTKPGRLDLSFVQSGSGVVATAEFSTGQ